MSKQQIPGLPNPLPAAFAFVVQFGVATEPAGEHMSGRIEHVVSGRQRRFTNAAELLAALREMLTMTTPDRTIG